jgi:phage N-6-adenine-methyltransferase
VVIFEKPVYTNKTDEWATPPHFLRRLDSAVGGFDLDPASGAEDHDIIKETYDKQDDGLSQKWQGTVFLNPPFSNKVDWIQKAKSEVNKGGADTVVMLLPVDTSTSWFHDHVTQATLTCFVGPGRMDFDRRSEPGNKGCPSFAIMVVVFGDIPDKKLFGFLGSRGTIYWQCSLYQREKQSNLSNIISNSETEDDNSG